MPKEPPSQYNPADYEDKIYKKWENSGFFNPDNLVLEKNAESYTIVLPPPNITDKLHLGHAAMLAIEDLLIRFKRMQGYRALWIPGTDHAAIATQNVVEKKLLKEKNLTRHDLGRDKFLVEVDQFLKTTQATILNQTRKMGASLDWSRQAFTLDEQRQKAVAKMFCDMYAEGVIYRGERIVNWCPRCQSTLADDEVEYKASKTILYTFKYSKDFPISIATTRPETKLGDTAVAVNPRDPRYKKYLNKVYLVNFCGIDLNLKIIADHEVDPNFGTGALGVTPAHSMADAKIAEKNNLKTIKVISEDGKIRDSFKEFSNLSVKQAQEKIIENLRKNNLIKKEEEIENNLSVCYRCDTPIEPLPSRQWFIAVDKKLARLGNKSLKQKAIEAAENNKIKFTPERFKKRYLDWMENLHDWCISRQIWFGHRIPVWYKNAEIYFGEIPPQGEGWTQDEDTLDTWFSSGMWTFSTLGWPENTKDLKQFHPTQVLETGYEIITLWVSRMIMMSFFALDQIPFENVYLHGMILDKHGKKMSKSKGNGIDPIDVINKFGTDAVRLSLLIGSTPGNDTKLSEEKIEQFRNFANKLWNIARFIITNYELKVKNYDFKLENFSLVDNWILAKLNNLIQEITVDLEKYNFSEAGEKLKNFTWNDLADWYLESSKFENNPEKNKILNYILENLLKLWHPFMPFVTEVIWEKLEKEKLLMIEKWPAPHPAFGTPLLIRRGAGGEVFDLIQNIIIAIRNARSENKIEPGKKIKAIIYAGENTELIKSQINLIKNLKTGISELEVKAKGEKIEKAIYAVINKIEIYLIAEVDPEKEKARLEKEKINLEKLIHNQAKKLANQEFTQKAPENIVKQEQEKLALWEAELEKIKYQLNSF